MRPLLAALSIVIALPSLCQAADTVEVHIDNFTFVPATITVPKGGTVVWSNRDDMVHSVVASDASFKSAPLDTDDRYSHTFTEAGEVTYFCGLHPQMIGHIVVKP